MVQVAYYGTLTLYCDQAPFMERLVISEGTARDVRIV